MQALQAITVDAFGTVVELGDPVPELREALARRGVDASPETVARAFRSEVAFYLPRSHHGRNAASLEALRRECAAVFLAEAGAALDPTEFTPAFVGSLRFRPLPGSVAALTRLRSAGLRLACVSNWDCSLAAYLDAAGVAAWFDALVSSAEAGAPKPDPRPFRLALERLGVPPARALHVGDDEADRLGAEAAGLAFEPAPLVTLPARLGLG
jgi:putative hydrolase of the HAD superfamily